MVGWDGGAEEGVREADVEAATESRKTTCSLPIKTLLSLPLMKTRVVNASVCESCV